MILLLMMFVFMTHEALGFRRLGYVAQCVEPGLKCANCQDLIFCLGTSPDSLQQISITSCNNTQGSYCSVSSGGCSTDKRVCDIFGMNNIQCQDSGLFPDPFDCTSYHECVPDSNDTGYTDIRRNCKLGLAYDPLSTICRLKKTDRVCRESPVPKCLKSLQMGALVENPTLYYICIGTADGIYPRLYRCPYGLLFDGRTSQCVESLSPTTTLSPKVVFKCPSSGTFPDQYDCRKYYICNSQLIAQHRTCREGSYFDPTIKLCVLGMC